MIELSIADVVQLARTFPCQGRGRGFESRRPLLAFALLEQKVKVGTDE